MLARPLSLLVALLTATPAWAGGIGVQLDVRPWGVVVYDVVPGAPADGVVKPEDVIVAVNGAPVTDVDAAVAKIRGDDGTRVHLDLRRSDAPLSVDLVRAPTTPPATGTVPLTLALGDNGLVRITGNAHGDGWGGLRVGDDLVAIDNVHPTSVDDAAARLSGANGSDAQLFVFRRVRGTAWMKTYHIPRAPAPPEAVSAAERTYRADLMARRTAAGAERRAAEDAEPFQGDPGRLTRAYMTAQVYEARYALGTSKPRPVEPDDHFCRNLFALVLDYEHRFERTRGDVVPAYEKDVQLTTIGEEHGTRYYLRADLPGFEAQSLWVSNTNTAVEYRAVVRREVLASEAKGVLRDVATRISTCSGPLLAPNYPIQLFGGTSAGDDALVATWLVLKPTAAYTSEMFQLQLVGWPISGAPGYVTLALAMGPEIRL